MVDVQLVFASMMGRVVESIQYHGWTVVGVLLLLAVFKNDLRAFVARRQHAASLLSANGRFARSRTRARACAREPATPEPVPAIARSARARRPRAREGPRARAATRARGATGERARACAAAAAARAAAAAAAPSGRTPPPRDPGACAAKRTLLYPGEPGRIHFAPRTKPAARQP